jgi:hypothetical protein
MANSRPSIACVQVPAKKLEAISYCDQPLSQQGAKIVSLSPQEFAKKFNCEYSESVHGAHKVNQNCIAELFPENRRTVVTTALAEKIIERLNNPLDCLVICKMDEVGHGLFTSCSIPAGVLLCVYAGEVKQQDTVDIKQDNYLYNLTTPLSQAGTYVTTPHKIGGMARFMQHLPQHPSSSDAEDEELNDVVFTDPNIRITYQNVNNMLVNYFGTPLILMFSATEIPAGTQLGFSYGQQYWRMRNTHPRYFAPDGQLIPASAYYFKSDREKVSKVYLFNGIMSNPVLMYDKAVEMYKDHKYQQAIAIFKKSASLFLEKNPKAGIDVGKCMSGMASCYRDLDDKPMAIESCELAIQAYTQGGFEQMETIIKKYQTCLEKSGKTVSELYTYADAYYDKRQMELAAPVFDYVLRRYKNMDGEHGYEIAACHTSLSSCYHMLGRTELAIEHGNESLALLKSIEGTPADVIHAAEKKLAVLHDVVTLKNQPKRL